MPCRSRRPGPPASSGPRCVPRPLAPARRPGGCRGCRRAPRTRSAARRSSAWSAYATSSRRRHRRRRIAARRSSRRRTACAPAGRRSCRGGRAACPPCPEACAVPRAGTRDAVARARGIRGEEEHGQGTQHAQHAGDGADDALGFVRGGSMPNRGCAGIQPQGTLPGRAKAHSTNTSTSTETAFDSASPRPEALCASRGRLPAPAWHCAAPRCSRTAR